jgi:voltage-gated potassium channel
MKQRFQLSHKLLIHFFNFSISLITFVALAYIPFNVLSGINITLGYYKEFFLGLDLILNLIFAGKFSYIEGQNSLRKYLRTWFLLDLVSAFPFWLFSSLTIFEFTILIKFFKVAFFFSRIENSLVGRTKDAFNFASLLMFTLMVAHIIACFWMYLGKVDAAKTDLDNYLMALYWAMTTITTIGYGDITPETQPQIIFTMVVQIIGVTIFGFLIGKIAGIFSKKDPAEMEYYSQIEKLDALHRQKPFSESLYHKVKSYFQYRLENRLGSNEAHFLSELPAALRSEVSLHLKSDLIEKIPLFSSAGQVFVEKISQALSIRLAIPKEYIFKAGEPGDDMYFIVQGEVEVFSATGEYLATLNEGNFFGEIALIKNQPRNASIQAKTFCSLYRLEKSDFETIIAQFPDVEAQIKQKASLRS